MSIENEKITEQQAKEALESNLQEAEEILKDEDKVERFLQRLEKKIELIPLAGKRLATVPVMASLVRSFVKKEYTDIPIGSIIAIVGALLYFVKHIDIIPDSIPVLGYFDDAAVVAVCWKMVEDDVREYQNWREKYGKKIEE